MMFKLNITGKGIIKAYILMVFCFFLALICLIYFFALGNDLWINGLWQWKQLFIGLLIGGFFWFFVCMSLELFKIVKKELKRRRYENDKIIAEKRILQKRTLENFKVFLPTAKEMIKTPGVDGMTLEEVHRVYWSNFKLIDEEHWKALKDFWNIYDQVERAQKSYQKELEQAKNDIERLRNQLCLQQENALLQESNLYYQSIVKMLNTLLDEASLTLVNLNKYERPSGADKEWITFKSTGLSTLTKTLNQIEFLLSKEWGLWTAVQKHLAEKILLNKLTGWSSDQLYFMQTLHESWQNLNNTLEIGNKKTAKSLEIISSFLSRYLEINKEAEDLLENYQELQKNLILRFFDLKKRASAMENKPVQMRVTVVIKDALKDTERFLQEPNPQWDIIKYKLSGLKTLIGE